jgi:hypothetical protein
MLPWEVTQTQQQWYCSLHMPYNTRENVQTCVHMYGHGHYCALLVNLKNLGILQLCTNIYKTKAF